MSIGEKLKNCRKEAGLTQEYVCEQINVSRQTISNWENEKTLPDIYSLVSLSEIYGISLDQLIKGDTVMINKFKVDKTTKTKNQNYLIMGLCGIIIFLIGQYFSSHLGDLIKGAGTGIMIASFGFMAVFTLRNFLTDRKKLKKME